MEKDFPKKEINEKKRVKFQNKGNLTRRSQRNKTC